MSKLRWYHPKVLPRDAFDKPDAEARENAPKAGFYLNFVPTCGYDQPHAILKW
jgi:hypothetical protein